MAKESLNSKIENTNIEKEEERLLKKNQFDGNLIYGAKDFHEQTNRSGKGKPSSGFLTREQNRIVLDTTNDRYKKINPEEWEEVSHCPVCGDKKRD